MIKAILFDFDGVLTTSKTGSEPIIKFISNKCNIPIEIVKESYYKHNDSLLNGKITHQDILSELSADIQHDIDYDILIQAFQNTRLDKNMITLLKELKKSYLIAMVTDNKTDRIDTVLEFNNLSAYFDYVTISARLHSRKDKPYIFEDVVKHLSVNPNECVFIDNTAENLVIPNQMGMKTILFDDEGRDVTKFKNTLTEMLS